MDNRNNSVNSTFTNEALVVAVVDREEEEGEGERHRVMVLFCSA